MFSESQGLFIGGGTFTNNQTLLHNVYNSNSETPLQLWSRSISPNAFHDSGDVMDPPKCHPGTRVTVLEYIQDWIFSMSSKPEVAEAAILWLYAAAGAGKSAIARSIAEWCVQQKIYMASFFFFRADPTRNHTKSIVATLAYNLAVSIPELRVHVERVVEIDPLIFTRSLQVQIINLLVAPLEASLSSAQATSNIVVIIIDGLDECLISSEHGRLLKSLSSLSNNKKIGWKIIVASRPELTISTSFNDARLLSFSSRLALSNESTSHADIYRFLVAKLVNIRQNHPLKAFIPIDWPSSTTVKIVVAKSSGQFIYAATIIKYISSPRHNPSKLLDAVLGPGGASTSPGSGLPFAALDALYSDIVNSVVDVPSATRIIAICILFTRMNPGPGANLRALSPILAIDEEEVQRVLLDLHSLLNCNSDGTHVSVYHASLEDFLFDPQRSGKLWVDPSRIYDDVASWYCQRLASFEHPRPLTSEKRGEYKSLLWAFFQSFEEADHGVDGAHNVYTKHITSCDRWFISQLNTYRSKSVGLYALGAIMGLRVPKHLLMALRCKEPWHGLRTGIFPAITNKTSSIDMRNLDIAGCFFLGAPWRNKILKNDFREFSSALRRYDSDRIASAAMLGVRSLGLQSSCGFREEANEVLTNLLYERRRREARRMTPCLWRMRTHGLRARKSKGGKVYRYPAYEHGGPSNRSKTTSSTEFPWDYLFRPPAANILALVFLPKLLRHASASPGLIAILNSDFTFARSSVFFPSYLLKVQQAVKEYMERALPEIQSLSACYATVLDFEENESGGLVDDEQ